MISEEHKVIEKKDYDEISAMREAYNALKDLKYDEKQRVFSWLQNKMDIKDIHEQKISLIEESKHDVDLNHGLIENFNNIPDVFASVNVKKDVDRVLLVAAYLQLKNKLPDLTSREINKELQHLGYRVKNITTTIQGLINRKPQLMIQTWKNNSSKQGQKKFKVTSEGIATAKKMLINTSHSYDGEKAQ